MIPGRKSAAVAAWLTFVLPICAQVVIPPAEPTNGIYVGPVKVYDETALEGLLNAAKANLASLNTFDQGTLNNHFGGVQGSTSAQTEISVQANGANVANPTAAPSAPVGFTLPSAFTPSAVDVLNEQMQAASQVINFQLLLKGSLNDQFEPDSGHARLRTTLGFPININVPPGYKYQHAVADIEVGFCTPPAPDPQTQGPLLMTLLPQSKTYNVAALVNKSTGLGGGLVAGVVNVGGSFLRGRSTYYLVQAQDTLAMQRPDLKSCDPKKLNSPEAEKKSKAGRHDEEKKDKADQSDAEKTSKTGQPDQEKKSKVGQPVEANEPVPLHFAWQFRPVLGQKVVQDGTRQTFAQISLPWFAGTMFGCSTTVVIRTSWKYYDSESGRVGREIKDSATKWELQQPGVFFGLPVADPISAEDNGDGTITVRAFGSFRDGLRVRIGSVIQDASTAGFEQNQQYVRFTASGLSLASHGAELVYKDGNYFDLDAAPPGATAFGNCPTPESKAENKVENKAEPSFSWTPQAHAVSIEGENTDFVAKRPEITANGLPITSFTVLNKNLIVADIDPLTKDLDIKINDKPDTKAADKTYKTVTNAAKDTYKPKETGVDVRAYNEASTLVTLKVEIPAPPTVGVLEVAVIGSKVYGLKDNPFYARTDKTVSILVPNDVVRSNRAVLWRQLFTPQTRIFPLDFAKPAGDLITKQSVSDFQITGVQLLSNSGGSGSSTKTFALSDISLKWGAQAWTGTGVFAVSNGTPAIMSVTPSGAQPGETLADPVTITGAFTHFTQGKPPDVVFSDTDIPPPSGVTVVDDTHLHANVKVTAGATPQSSSVTVTSGGETAVGTSVFTVGNAKALITAINPKTADASGRPLTGVTITGSGTHFMRATPTIGFSNSKVSATVTSVDSDTQLTVSLTAAADAPPGPTDIKVTTGAGDAAEVAVGTALLTVGPSTPRIESVTPAAGQPGETLPVSIRLTYPLPAGANPAVTFSNLGIRLTKLMKKDDLTWTGTVNITSDALSNASAAPDTSTKATNTYLITGSHLPKLKFLFPTGVVKGPVQRDTMLTFSLSDDQVKQTKNILVQFDDFEPVSFALPAPPSDSSTPAAPSLKAQTMPIAINAPSVTVSGTGMKKVTDVQFQDKPLVFTSASDTSLTVQTPQCPVTNNTNGCVWPPTGPAPSEIDLVFIYADQTKTRYAVAVQPPAPK
jgi:hypothetical protein